MAPEHVMAAEEELFESPLTCKAPAADSASTEADSAPPSEAPASEGEDAASAQSEASDASGRCAVRGDGKVRRRQFPALGQEQEKEEEEFDICPERAALESAREDAAMRDLCGRIAGVFKLAAEDPEEW